MNILGINIYGHDTAACLVVDGKIVAAIEEERLSRQKHDKRFPILSIQKCLQMGGLEAKDIDLIVASKNFELLIKEKYLKYTLDMFPKANQLLVESIDNLKYILNVENEIREKVGYNGKIEYVNHHVGHIASSYFTSGFDKAALVSIDGLGEIESTLIGVAVGNDVKTLEHIDYPHSLGLFYGAVTYFLGFDPTSAAGTTMALASFGNADTKLKDGRTYYNVFVDMVNVGEDGNFTIELDYFNFPYTKKGWVSSKFIDIFGEPRQKDTQITEHHKNIAAALQKRFEDAYIAVINRAHKLTGFDKVCVAGGCALNCVANGKILSHTPFKEVYIQPAASDSGTAIGAALLMAVKYDENKPNLGYTKDTYLGPSYSDEEIEKALIGSGKKYEKVEDPAVEAAKMLADGKVVGWFQGRMEFGPRALGNRSILANPSTAQMKDRLNLEVKHREAFRPFAPSVLKERISEYFEATSESPFMLLAFKVRDEKAHEVPAIIHADGTGRVQSVEQEINPLYHRLIAHFDSLTGLPVVLNTSFNDKGEPIVCSPQDAIASFEATNLDALVIGDYVVRNDNSAKLSIRKARKDDCKNIWLWWNDPVTRAMMKKNGQVPWEDHCVWFDKILVDDSRVLLVGEVDGEAVGVVRFLQEADGVYEVSINLAPEARGKGIGSKLLGLGLKHLKQAKSVQLAFAMLKKSNIASKRTFEKNGFAFTAPTGEYSKTAEFEPDSEYYCELR